MFNYVFSATATGDPKFKRRLRVAPDLGLADADVAALGAARDQLRAALASPATAKDAALGTRDAAVAWGELVAAYERYLPWLEGLRSVVARAVESRRSVYNDALVFTWKTVLARGHSKGSVEIDSLNWELTYVYMSYAYALSNLATYLVAFANTWPSPQSPSDPSTRMSGNLDTGTLESRYNRAADLLSHAAGVFAYVEDKLLPLWVNSPTNRPVETLPGVCKALAQIALANATRVAVQKSLFTSIPSPALCAKLMADVSHKYVLAQDAISAGLSQRDRDALSLELTKWTQEWSGRVGHAQIERWGAISEEKTNQLGLAIGRSRSALARLKEADAESHGTKQFRAFLASEIHEVEALVAKLERDNDSITFQPVVCDLFRPLPKSLYTLPEYSPPRPAFGAVL